jgi:hypothetical protein
VSTPTWKRYPWVPPWGDAAEFTFPDCDGARPELGVATYFVDGFLRGRRSGRSYAFMTIFTDMRVLAHRVRASFHTVALYDCDAGDYGTSTEYDFPAPPFVRRRHRLQTLPGSLALRWLGGTGASRWENRRDPGGRLEPFAWTLDLRARDHRGRPMALTLEMDAQRPPAPLGGAERRGEMMFLGAPRTWSYFQSGLTMRGLLAWGDEGEEVDGTVGWIDRQWARRHFGTHQDRRSTRYRSEWRVIQLDDGWDMSCFHQYHRPAGNAVVPWSGLSAQGPGPEFPLRATTRVDLVVPEFVRSPGVVRARHMLTRGPRWFPHRYRLRAPDWDLDLASEPLVTAPAHALPIEYWTGPVRVRGRAFGRTVAGLGFDERTRPWFRDFELALALRATAEDLPDGAALAHRAWEVAALALRGGRRAAGAHVRAHLRPLVAALAEPGRTLAVPLARDLATLLGA